MLRYIQQVFLIYCTQKLTPEVSCVSCYYTAVGKLGHGSQQLAMMSKITSYF